MQWTVTKVRKALNGRLVGSVFMQEIVCKTILFLPATMIKQICATVWFISSPEDAWAFTFRGADLKHRSLIFISDELLRQDENQIQYTVLHEIGHVVLQHRNSIGYEQTETEINMQETAADRFAQMYLEHR